MKSRTGKIFPLLFFALLQVFSCVSLPLLGQTVVNNVPEHVAIKAGNESLNNLVTEQMKSQEKISFY